MPATELTEERRRDLELLQMRDTIDEKARYRKSDHSTLPKFFQVNFTLFIFYSFETILLSNVIILRFVEF